MALTMSIHQYPRNDVEFVQKGSRFRRDQLIGGWNNALSLSIIVTRKKKIQGEFKPRIFRGNDVKHRGSLRSSATASNTIYGLCSSDDDEVVKGSTEVIIVGAGVSGAALAYALAKDGRSVHVLERDLSEPDRFAGELLQPGGYLKLQELNLADCVDSIDAQKVIGCALYRHGKHLQCPYPLEEYHPDVAGRGFHNGRFVQSMRNKAASLPNVELEQGTVTSLIKENGNVIGVEYRTKDGQELRSYAPLTVMCNGCFSNMRRSLCKPKVDVHCHGHGVGLVLENCNLPFPNFENIVLGDPLCVAFFPISSNEVRCFIDVPEQRLPSLASGELARYLKSVVAPQVPEEIYPSFIAAVEKGDIRSMPNKSMPPAIPPPSPGALLIADSLNVRNPVTAGGMTVALNDVVVLRDLLRALNNNLTDCPELHKHLESFYTFRNNPTALTINMLAGAVCKVNYLPAKSVRKELFNAFFDYLSLGGSSASQAMSYVSCMNSHLMSLGHGFIIGVTYAVGRLLIPFPTPQRIWIIGKMTLVASEIISTTIRDRGVQIFVSRQLFQHMTDFFQSTGAQLSKFTN